MLRCCPPPARCCAQAGRRSRPCVAPAACAHGPATLLGFASAEASAVRSLWGSVCEVQTAAESDSVALAGGRVVLLPPSLGADVCASLHALLLDAHLPAVFGLQPAPGSGASPSETAVALLHAHERQWGLRRLVATRPTAWRTARARAAASFALPVPGGAAAVVVLDGLVDEPTRAALLEWLTGRPGCSAAVGAAPGPRRRRPGSSAAVGAAPGPRWRRATRDLDGAPPGWGLSARALRALASPRRAPPAAVEVQSRLAALYPEYEICWLPGETMQPPGCAAVAPLVANAALATDAFGYHRDAQPEALTPHSPWAQRFGLRPNRTPGAPLLVSLVLYLNDVWRRGWGADTLLLDERRGVGAFVQPRPGRVVLMDQDVLHRLSAPAAAARRPRFSLVWKLALWPRDGGEQQPTIARPQWECPPLFGGGG